MALKRLELAASLSVSGLGTGRTGWHPNGDYIAFSNGRVLSWNGTALASAASRTLTTGNDLDWHPNGNFIAWAGDGVNGLVDAWNGTNALTAAASYDAEASSMEAVRWHPDGDHVAFGHVSGLGNANVSMLEWNGSNALSLAASIVIGSTANALAWHPSGDYLAVAGGSRVRVYAWDGSAFTEVEDYPAGFVVLDIRWDPNGAFLVASGIYNLAVMSWTGGDTLNIRALYTHSDVIREVGWHPDGAHIVHSSSSQSLDVLRWNGNNALALAVTTAASSNTASWDPTGAYVAGFRSPSTARVWEWLPSVEVAVTTPAPDAVLIDPLVTVEWTTTEVTGNPVYEHRVLVTHDIDGTVYDSGLLTQETQDHDIPPGYMVNDQTYQIRVRAIDPNDGDTVEDSVQITTAWTQPPAIEGVTVTPVDGPPPGLLVEWGQPTVEDPFTYAEYNVYRRTPATTDIWGQAVDAGPWVRIARIPSYDTLSYTDYNVGSGVEYEYAVTWWALGGLQSEQQAPPASGTVSWEHAFIHDASNAAIYTQVYVQALGVEQQQDIVDVAVRGRASGVAFTGERFERVYSVAVSPGAIDDTGRWERLRSMLERQHTHGASYCLRIGHSGEVVFGRLEPVRRTDQSMLSTPDLRFVERYYREAM